jgi:antibiotic biosynthesis monooxygenase (ABM) superfamily enzyme
MDEAATAVYAHQPVTVVVTRRVRPGRESDYEDWLRRLFQEAAALPGYLGANVERPPVDARVREYTSVFRFDTVDNLRAFERSDMRRRFLAEVVDYVESEASWHQLSGLEFWFTPPKGTVVPQPARWRMALLMIVVVYSLVMSLGQIVGLVLAQTPLPFRMLVTIVIEVFFMTYVLMPRLTRLLAKWIYPTARPTHT